MGKKGSWFSSIKKVFTSSSKDAPDGTERKSLKEKKKKGLGKLKHGDGHSFIPLFREPSSIEKILGEAERENHFRNHRPLTPHITPVVRNDPSPQRDASPPSYGTQSTPLSTNYTHPTPPRVSSPPQAAMLVNEVTPARAPSSRNVRQWRPDAILKNRHMCATKIQTAYRAYMARRSYRALRGLERLQGVVKGQSVKRQTANALKCMQMMVRLQTQIQARRIHMLENQAQQRQGLSKNGNDLESAFGKWMSENQEDWDDSTLTKEEIEARMQRKFDAIVKRERAMAYSYTHQSWKSTPRIGHGALADFRTGGYPYCWNWLNQRQPPPPTPLSNLPKTPPMKNFSLTSTKPTIDFKASPLPQSSNKGQSGLEFNNMDTSTPISTHSSVPAKTQTRTPQRISKGSAATSQCNGQTFKDNDSLMSCPSFSVPRYMTPTVSAQAKLKDGKEQFPNSPGSITSDVSKRRSSFPLGQVGGSFKWNKGSMFSKKETNSKKDVGKSKRTQSVGNLSIDSSTSMPASVGRRAFNRFV